MLRLLLSFSIFNSVIGSPTCSWRTEPVILTYSQNCTIDENDASGIFSTGILLSLSDQDMCFTPSTVTNNTIAIGKDVCASDENLSLAQCASLHGRLFDIDSAKEKKEYTEEALSELAPDPGWETVMNPYKAFSAAGSATLRLPGAAVTMTIAVQNEGVNFTGHHLGLGPEAPIFSALDAQDVISARVFGLNVGQRSSSSGQPSQGNLIIGGIDNQRTAGSMYEFDMTEYSVNLNDRVCPLQVEMVGMTLQIPGEEDETLISESQPAQACLEGYDGKIRLPPIPLDTFQRLTGYYASDIELDQSNFALVEPGLLYNGPKFAGSLTVTLKGGLEVKIPNSELCQPARALDRDGQYVSLGNISEVNIYNRSAPLNAAVLGRAFLSQIYLAVNYDKKKFRLYTGVPNVDADPIPGFWDTSSCSGLTAAEKGEIGLGVVLFVLLVAVMVMGWLFWKKGRHIVRTNENGNVLEEHRAGIGEDLLL